MSLDLFHNLLKPVFATIIWIYVLWFGARCLYSTQSACGQFIFIREVCSSSNLPNKL